VSIVSVSYVALRFKFLPVAASVSHFDSEAIIITPTFDALPMEIIRASEKQGYDNNNPKDRITGVTYKVKIYFVQENIHSVLEVEETLLHEHIHQILHGEQNDVDSMWSIYYR
jgi:hypothetical protein